MLPRGIIYWLLQSLLLFALPSLPDAKEFNGSRSDSCIELDTSVVNELISTLESSGIKVWKNDVGETEDRRTSIPLETLESNWMKLKTVADTLPERSDFEAKLKRLFKLLLAAHDQTTSHQVSLAPDLERLIPVMKEEERLKEFINASKEEHQKELINATKEERQEELLNTTKKEERLKELLQTRKKEELLNTTKKEERPKELVNATKEEEHQKELINATKEEEHQKELINATKKEEPHKELTNTTPEEEEESSIQNFTDSSFSSAYNSTENYKTYTTVIISDTGTIKNVINETSIVPTTVSDINYSVVGSSTISNELRSLNSITNDFFLNTTIEMSDPVNGSTAINFAMMTAATESSTESPTGSHETMAKNSMERYITLKNEDSSLNYNISGLSKQSESSTVSNTRKFNEIASSQKIIELTEPISIPTSATEITSPQFKLQTNNSITSTISTEQRNQETQDKNSTTTLISTFNSNNSTSHSLETIGLSAKPSEVSTEHIITATTKESTGVTNESNSTLQHFSSSPILERLKFEKNPQLTNAPKMINIILRNFTHNDDNSVSKQITLYEVGSSGGTNGRIWKPQLVGRPPNGNRIWNTFNHHREEAKPDVASIPTPQPDYDYGRFFRPHPSRKRASPNADVDRTLRRFYNRGQMDPSTKSRDRSSEDAKITIQCLNAKRR